MIWPSIHGRIIENDLAVFIGEKAHEPPRADNPNATRPRLFAAKAPEPPLDITDEVLWRWSKESGKDSAKAIEWGGIVYFKEGADSLDAHFVFWTTENWPGAVITLDWNRISDIMREVKQKGVVRKDRVWGTAYVEKEFKFDAEQ